MARRCPSDDARREIGSVPNWGEFVLNDGRSSHPPSGASDLPKLQLSMLNYESISDRPAFVSAGWYLWSASRILAQHRHKDIVHDVYDKFVVVAFGSGDRPQLSREDHCVENLV